MCAYLYYLLQLLISFYLPLLQSNVLVPHVLIAAIGPTLTRLALATDACWACLATERKSRIWQWKPSTFSVTVTATRGGTCRREKEEQDVADHQTLLSSAYIESALPLLPSQPKSTEFGVVTPAHYQPAAIALLTCCTFAAHSQPATPTRRLLAWGVGIPP